MPYSRRTSLSGILLALSRALDLTSSGILAHHQMVALTAARICGALGLDGRETADIFHAALIHDLGIPSRSEVEQLMSGAAHEKVGHATLGAERLALSKVLAPLAPLVRHHHTRWGDGEDVPRGSRIIHVADRFATLLARTDSAEDALAAIRRESGVTFDPRVVQALAELASSDSFQLDLTTDFLPSIVEQHSPSESVIVDSAGLLGIARVFATVIDQKSSFTRQHSRHVASVGGFLAARAGFSDYEVTLMEIACLLHDIGKLSVPDEILDSPRKLAPEEKHVMRRHSYFTFHILKPIDGFQTVAEWASFHHERLDGTGYPFRLKGTALPLGARVVAVADFVSALAEARPYRSALSPNELRMELEHSVANGALDGALVADARDCLPDLVALIDAPKAPPARECA